MAFAIGMGVGMLFRKSNDDDDSDNEKSTQTVPQITQEKCKICGDVMMLVGGVLKCKNCGHDRSNGA